MRINNIHKEKIKLIFSGFVVIQIFIIITYFKFGSIHQKNELDRISKVFPKMEFKLKFYRDMILKLIPQREAILRAIQGDIVALLFLISKKFKLKPQNVISQFNLTSSSANDYLNKKTPTIAVLIIACNRSGVERTIKQVIKYRPNNKFWPLLISQGCEDLDTKKIIMKYHKHFTSFVTNVPHVNIINAKPQFKGYYKISAHFKLALDYAFKTATIADAVIIIEDDLDIASDFFEYFSATYWLLKEDSTLYCVSAFNDNGRPALINQTGYSTLYRTDFFPGLGWMLLRSTWLELRKEWPLAFWDDFMRSLLIRRSRSCIRPEISRSSTFGVIGVSNGQFFNKYLKTIQLNKVFTKFSNLDLSYLHIDNFDAFWASKIDNALLVDWHTFRYSSENPKTSVKIMYYELSELQEIADAFELMSDLRDGIPRTAYKGVVSFFWHSVQVFLIPAFIE